MENRLYLFVKNQTPAAKLVTVRLAKIGPDGKTLQTLAEKQLLVPNGETVPVKLAPPPEPAAKAGEGKPKEGKAAPPPLTPLTGPPFNLFFQVLTKDKAGKEVVLADEKVFFQILQPNEVVRVEPPEFEIFKEGGDALFVKATAIEKFTLPPAKLDLVLLPGRASSLGSFP